MNRGFIRSISLLILGMTFGSLVSQTSILAANSIGIPVFGTFEADTMPAARVIAGLSERAGSDDGLSIGAETGEPTSTPSGDGPVCPITEVDQNGSSPTQVSLEGLFPAYDAANAAGFLPLGIETAACVEDSFYAGLDDESNDIGWEAGVRQGYLPGEAWSHVQGVIVLFDRFDSADAASNIMDQLARDPAVRRNALHVASTDQLVAFRLDFPDDDRSSTFIFARLNDVIVIVTAGAALDQPTFAAAKALWKIVDEANH
jgi:hypothetical protein